VERPSRFKEIIRSSAKVGLSTLAGLLGWVVAGKILAVELGAAGVGVFGLLRQLLQSLTLVSTFSGSTALIQGIASRSGSDSDDYARSVARIFAASASVVAITMLVGAPWLAPFLLPHADGVRLLRWLSLAVVATTAQTYFTGLLNGHGALDALVRCQLLAPAAVLLAAYPTALLVRAGEPAGFVLLLFAPGALVGWAGWIAARASGWLRPGVGARRGDFWRFLKTSSVLLATSLLGSGTQYLQNRLVAGSLGLVVAAHYWVAWTLSMAYVSILLNSYAAYYMPSLSGLSDRPARQSLIRDYLRLALLVMPALVSAVVLVKPLVVRALFSAELLPALKVMRWMLIGDYFKGVAWVLSFPMLAFNELRWFLWTEVAFGLFLAGGSWLWIARGGGIEGLGVLFLAVYVVYAVAMWAYVRRQHGLTLGAREMLGFVAGLALVVAVSLVTWSDQEVRPGLVMACAVLSAALVIFVFTRLRSARKLARG
jgi:PST family polysaccharide transporter